MGNLLQVPELQFAFLWIATLEAVPKSQAGKQESGLTPWEGRDGLTGSFKSHFGEWQGAKEHPFSSVSLEHPISSCEDYMV
ncbi:uncharacterized protein LOC101677814 [Mustela putorius furo]|uniref:Uncharacterized protein LOC101677814 n=1 Tax=Mustela putorius furo TaxID=9669 RepID=A0A8U0UP53_MUSPF|nr:uncharacterized protein LOC101677814 [Mustela putorius furo]